MRVPPVGNSWRVLELAPDFDGSSRHVAVEFAHEKNRSLRLRVCDLHGRPLGSFGGRLEAQWPSPTYCIAAGNMLLAESWRGLRIGTWCQNQVIGWVLAQPPGAVRPFELVAGDARTEAIRDRRNRFYEQFGIRFDWTDIPGYLPRSAGFSAPDLATVELHTLHDVPGVIEHDVLQLLQQTLRRAGNAERELECRETLITALRQEVTTAWASRQRAIISAYVIVVLALVLSYVAWKTMS